MTESDWNRFRTIMVKAAEGVCGRCKIGKNVSRDEWWWAGEVQDAVRMKREALKEVEFHLSDQARER